MGWSDDPNIPGSFEIFLLSGGVYTELAVPGLASDINNAGHVVGSCYCAGGPNTQAGC